MHQKRVYRNHIDTAGLPHFEVTVKETNLFIQSPVHLEPLVRELVFQCRGDLEAYIDMHPEFARTLFPWQAGGPAPAMVRDMISAGCKAGTGPMAAVAGAVAEYVGNGLLAHTGQVVVENGGDVFLKTNEPVTIGIFAGQSPLSMKIGLQIDARKDPFAVCTSSGTVGHSLSRGSADAVCVVSSSCSLADATATSIGNRVRSEHDIQDAIDYGKAIDGIDGLLVIRDKHIGMWGAIEVVPVQVKKG